MSQCKHCHCSLHMPARGIFLQHSHIFPCLTVRLPHWYTNTRKPQDESMVLQSLRPGPRVQLRINAWPETLRAARQPAWSIVGGKGVGRRLNHRSHCIRPPGFTGGRGGVKLGSPVRASAESNEVHGLPRWGNLLWVHDL